MLSWKCKHWHPGQIGGERGEEAIIDVAIVPKIRNQESISAAQEDVSSLKLLFLPLLLVPRGF